MLNTNSMPSICPISTGIGPNWKVGTNSASVLRSLRLAEAAKPDYSGCRLD